MTDQEIIDAMKTLLYPVSNKLESLEIGLDTLRLEQKVMKQDIKQEIHALRDEMDTLIGVLEAHGLLPKAK